MIRFGKTAGLLSFQIRDIQTIESNSKRVSFSGCLCNSCVLLVFGTAIFECFVCFLRSRFEKGKGSRFVSLALKSPISLFSRSALACSQKSFLSLFSLSCQSNPISPNPISTISTKHNSNIHQFINTITITILQTCPAHQ